MRQLHEVRVQYEPTGEPRAETLMGRSYTVFPVIMLVEGVVQGANSTQPEYVPASELAKNPTSWNGRPLVMNHPQIQGVYVSANSPEVLEDWSFGFVFNAEAEDGKLKAEAWVDNLRAEELGGDAERALERLNNGEVVETSTGLWADTTAKSGKFNGRAYKGVWSNIVPDHLAVLSEDLIGACSIADGCGVGRANQAVAIDTATINQLRFNSQGYRTISLSDGGCGCGGACGGSESEEPGGKMTLNIDSIMEGIKKLLTGASDELSPQTIPEPTTEEIAALEAAFAENWEPLTSEQALSVNSIPSGMTIDNVRQLLARALKIKFPNSYVYVYTATSDVVVYQSSSYYSYDNDNLFQISYSMDSDGDVTFTGEPEPVILLTRIVVKNDAVPTRVNSGNQSQEVEAMAGESTKPAADPNGNGQGAGSQPAATTEQAPAQPAVQAAATATATEPMTTEQYLASLPEAVRGNITRALAREASQKTDLIGKIKAHANNKFSDAQLEAFDVDTLESIHAMAGGSNESGVQDYSGRAAPGTTTTTPQVNAGKETEATPQYLEAPQVFEGTVSSRFGTQVSFDLGNSKPAGQA